MSEHTIKYTVTPFVGFTKETLGLDITLPSGQIAREVMNLKERAIREGLIALGWTPPGIADRLAEALEGFTDIEYLRALGRSEDSERSVVWCQHDSAEKALAAYEKHKKGNTP